MDSFKLAAGRRVDRGKWCLIFDEIARSESSSPPIGVSRRTDCAWPFEEHLASSRPARSCAPRGRPALGSSPPLLHHVAAGSSHELVVRFLDHVHGDADGARPVHAAERPAEFAGSHRPDFGDVRHEVTQQFWMPCLSVAVEDGQPEHEPFMWR